MFLKEMMDLSGKAAIVTGGTGFLGAKISEALLEMGASVTVISRGQSENFLGHLEGCKELHQISADMSTPEGILSALAVFYASVSPRIDVLVNNHFGWPKSIRFGSQSWDDFEGTMRSGFVSPMYLTQLAFNHMRENKVAGSIINIASMYGKVAPNHKIYRESGRGNAIEYGASKAAIIQSTRYIASIGGKFGIRCNSISPGPFPRPGTFDNGFDWFKDELSSMTMLGRPGRSDELKGAVAFLASDMSTYVTGIDIPVDGGWTAW